MPGRPWAPRFDRLFPGGVLHEADDRHRDRGRTGQPFYVDSFVAHWLSRLIFFEAPWWTFVVARTAFAALVAGCWWWLPPMRKPVAAAAKKP